VLDAERMASCGFGGGGGSGPAVTPTASQAETAAPACPPTDAAHTKA
jgi:hypothetical protein